MKALNITKQPLSTTTSVRTGLVNSHRMMERGKRIDGEENLASCCWNWKKKKNNGSRKWNQGKGREPYLTVGLPLGAVAAMVDRNGVGREEDRRPAGAEGTSRREKVLSGSTDKRRRAAAPVAEADAMRLANMPASACVAPVARALLPATAHRQGILDLVSSPSPVCVCVFFVVWAGRFASLRLALGPTTR